MINMKLTPAEAKEESGICCADDKGPAYPYGLSISLCDEVLAKLGMTTLPPVGTVMTLAAQVEVTGSSQYENQDGKDISLNLQITDMDLGAANKEVDAKAMYPNSTMI